MIKVVGLFSVLPKPTKLAIKVYGHRPVIVKRTQIGSKGGWKFSTIFKLKSASWLVNNKITGKKSYLLDGYIFAAFFETTPLCFC